MKKIFILLIALSTLAGCSVFSPVKVESPTIYVINPNVQPATKKPHHTINLLVALPEASSIYNTTDMAYTTRPYQIGYLAKSSWAESPSQMLQPLIIQTLRKTRYFHTVGTLSTIGEYNYILNTQIMQLVEDYSQIPHVVHLVLRAQILNTNTNQVLASKEFAAKEIIYQHDTYSGVQAANRAAARVMRQLAQFCLRSI